MADVKKVENEEKQEIDEEYIRKGKEALEKGIVYVGKLPFGKYATPSLLHLNQKGFVVLKARGKYIGKACALALFLENKLGIANKHTIELTSGEEDGNKFAEISIKIEK
jgi:DNA-binding protein